MLFRIISWNKSKYSSGNFSEDLCSQFPSISPEICPCIFSVTLLLICSDSRIHPGIFPEISPKTIAEISTRLLLRIPSNDFAMIKSEIPARLSTEIFPCILPGTSPTISPRSSPWIAPGFFQQCLQIFLHDPVQAYF